jgi:hypothetical protein
MQVVAAAAAVVAVLSVDMVTDGDGNDTALSVPGSSLTLSAVLSSCQALMKKHE